jgi:hypothetical protein
MSGTRLAHIREVIPGRERTRKPLQEPLPTRREQRVRATCNSCGVSAPGFSVSNTMSRE